MIKVLAAIKDKGELSKKIVEVASHIVKKQGGTLYIVYVYEVPLDLPLDEEVPEEIKKGDEILELATSVADEVGVNAKTHFIQSRKASAGILSEIEDLEIDIAVIGIRKPSVSEESPIGYTTEYLLKTAKCEFILVRPKMEQ